MNQGSLISLLHLVLTEHLSHVFVEPVEVIAHREGKLLDFGIGYLESRRALFCNPRARTDL